MNNWLILSIDTVVSCVSIILAYAIMVCTFGIDGHYITNLFPVLAVGILLWICTSLILKTHKHIIRYFTFGNIWRIFIGMFVQIIGMGSIMCVITLCEYFPPRQIWTFLLYYLAFSGTLLIGTRLIMILTYSWMGMNVRHPNLDNYLIFGTDPLAVSLEMRMKGSAHYDMFGYISNNISDRSLNITSKPVLYFKDEAHFRRYVEIYDIKGVIYINQDSILNEAKNIYEFSRKAGIKSLIVPGIWDNGISHISHKDIRNIKIEDLLGRDEIKVNINRIVASFNSKVIMVTGAAGSIGSELVRQLSTFGVKQIILFDDGETATHNLRLNLERKFPDLVFVPVIGDVRSNNRLDMVFSKYKPQIVFHAAAYKHVPLMEENPCEAVITNVMGTRQVAEMCIKYDVERMVMISTDKAVNPTNVMGATKRLAEIYVQSLSLAVENGLIKGKTKFVTTRFGNVLGSNGSVIPFFCQQIAEGGPVTVTHPEITRFFMTIPEACRLVMEAATMSNGSDIFVFDMGKSVKILDLAKRMIELAGYVPYKDIPITFMGLRPGEKLYEEVLSNKENTMPTDHKKIFHAKVRKYNLEDIKGNYKMLEQYASNMNIDDTIKIMKHIVPEYISQNSKFEKFDKA